MTIDQIRKQAYNGDADSCIYLMQIYAKGDSVEKSLDAAKAWGHKAITLIASGSKYSNVVTDKDRYELQSLANHGDADATLQLSFRYAKGDYLIKKDLDKAQHLVTCAINYYYGMSPSQSRNAIDQETRDKAAETYKRKLQRRERNRRYRQSKRENNSFSDDILSTVVGGLASGVSTVADGITSGVSQVADTIATGASQVTNDISRSLQSSSSAPSRDYYEEEQQGTVLSSVTKGVTNVLSGIVGILAALYLISPVDIVPDTIPVAGWLDDVGIVGGGVVIIFILQSFRKIVELLDSILQSLNKAITIATIIALTLIAILGVLIYHFFIMSN